MAKPIRNLRYYILALLLLSTLINYIDRQTLSILKNELAAEFHWSNEDYSHLVVAFLVAYAAMQLGSGFVMDRLGTRVGFALTMVFWSLAAIAHSGARSLFTFGVCRFLLGAGEAGNWPGSIRATSEWFPPKDRGFATGVWNTGSATGAVIAAPLVAWLASTRYGWQFAFVFTGSLGFIWLVLWLWLYHPPAQHPRVTGAERAMLVDSAAAQADLSSRSIDVFRSREAWGIAIARFISDPVWWFYLYWFPGYLGTERHFNLLQIGFTAWIPFLSADLGSLAGGSASSYLIRRGWSVLRARKTVMAASAALMLVSPFAAHAESAGVAVLLVSIAAFAHQSWASGILTLPADLFSGRVVATCSGFTGLWAAVGGLISTLAIGWVVDHLGHTPVFTCTGLMHPLAALIVFLLVRRGGAPARDAALPDTMTPAVRKP